MSHTDNFSKIYKDNTWGGSGGGSMPQVTVAYRKMLQDFLKEKEIKTVIDYGCGDWAFSHLIDWSHVNYLGVDCVQSVIDRNNQLYKKENIVFVCTESIAESTADLLILKDVLQHWSNVQIVHFLKSHAKNFKYVMITNNSDQTEDNQDAENAHVNTRPLSAKFLPLKQFNPTIILETNVNEPKETSLITRA